MKKIDNKTFIEGMKAGYDFANGKIVNLPEGVNLHDVLTVVNALRSNSGICSPNDMRKQQGLPPLVDVDIRECRSQKVRHLQNSVEVEVESTLDAINVVDIMTKIVSTFGVVTVADLYGIFGIEASSIDHRFGWFDISKVKLSRKPHADYVHSKRNSLSWKLSFPVPKTIK